MKDQKYMAGLVKVKRDAVIAGVTITRSVPFDVFGYRRVNAQNDVSDQIHCRLQRVIELIEEH